MERKAVKPSKPFSNEIEEENKSSYDKAVEILNQATQNISDLKKVELLQELQLLIIYKNPNLLDSFLDEVLAFQSDPSPIVRKCIVGFIEKACKKDPEYLPKVVANVQLFLQDEILVQIKVIQIMVHLYKVTLQWLCQARVVSELMETTWKYVKQIKEEILKLLYCNNEGICNQVIKFIEVIILMQSYPELDGVNKDEEFCLEHVPLTLKIARPRKLQEESKRLLEELIKFHGSEDISSINLITVMGALTNIGRQRPHFLEKIILAFESMFANLSPTLRRSQVSSVRKMLKLNLLRILNLPASLDLHVNITTLLTDLGTTTQEVMKYMPKPEELRKRQRIKDEELNVVKKSRLELNAQFLYRREDDDEDEDDDDQESDSRTDKNDTTSVLEQTILQQLTANVAAELVMVSMMQLPDTMPAHFSASYTPIAAAGTRGQIQHVARLLTTQLVHSGIVSAAKMEQIDLKVEQVTEEDEDDLMKTDIKKSIQTVIGGKAIGDNKLTIPIQLTPAGSLKPIRQRMKSLKLQDITKPLTNIQVDQFLKSTLQHILMAEKSSMTGGVINERNRIISVLASNLTMNYVDVVLNFIVEESKTRIDLALQWLYNEYCYLQGILTRFTSLDSNIRYDTILQKLLMQILSQGDTKERDSILGRIYHEIPIVTESAVDILQKFCQDEQHAQIGMHLFKSLVIHRPSKQLFFLNSLLELCSHEHLDVRTHALSAILEIKDYGDLGAIIEEYANMYLRFLMLPDPPDLLFGEMKGRTETVKMWSEDTIKMCLYLYMALLPHSHHLIHELASIYVQTSAEVKRTILRILEQPVRGMGMNSPQLLALLETCPRGAETLVTRIIHILTDKTPPSEALVSRVRELYQKRVSDVRFLIPVLNGLTKKEVIGSLPKLIKLNPVVVKEVFNRLLGLHVDNPNFIGPLTPAELLIALHNIDPAKCDVKTIIKATSLCFSERSVYTAEVLVVVIQQLVEKNPLPTLLMRTVIQSLTLYPRLIGFVMNILHRLITKQVWKQKRVWEGFIKCCQRIKMQCFPVLLQLPPVQLKEVLSVCSDLKEPLRHHVMAFTENQRACIPKSIVEVVMGIPSPYFERSIDSSPPSSPNDELSIHIQDDMFNDHEPAPPGED